MNLFLGFFYFPQNSHSRLSRLIETFRVWELVKECGCRNPTTIRGFSGECEGQWRGSAYLFFYAHLWGP